MRDALQQSCATWEQHANNDAEDHCERHLPATCHHTAFYCLLLLLTHTIFACPSPVHAQLGQLGYTVEAIYPQVGQVGTTTEVTVEGRFLHQPEEVLFYQPGIRCTNLTPISDAMDFQTGAVRKVNDGEAIRLTLQIDAHAKPGEYQLRVRTHDNLSELVTFWVTPFPVIAEEHAFKKTSGQDNDSLAAAQLVPLNSTIYGYVPNSQPQDHDWYAIDCHKGQRISVETVAARLGTLHYGGMNDPAVRIYDAEGNELGRNDDNAFHSQDPVVSVIIPNDGRYYIDMHQQMDYEAGRPRHYVLHIGSFARPLVAFPLGGPAGIQTHFRLIGDARGDLKANIRLPSAPGPFEAEILSLYADASTPDKSAEDTVSVNVDDSNKPPTPNRIHVAAFGDIFESAGHSSPDTSQQIKDSLPIAINGCIEAEGEVDWYRFSAKSGERYRVRTYGKTLDSELDPRVWIRPAPGNPSTQTYDEDDTRWESHDLVGHHYREQIKDRLDPIFMFEPDTDGEWLIGIGDTRREFGPRHIYRVEFQPHMDSAFIFFPAYPSQDEIVRDRIVLYPGHSYMHPVSVQPGFGSRYDGLLQIRATNLPAGVAFQARPFTQNDGIVPVLFSAAEDADIGADLIDIVVEPVDPNARRNFRGGFIQCLPATQRRGGYAMYFDRTRRMALAVVEGASFDVEIDRPEIPLVRNGELALNVRVARHGDFDGDVYCEMDWLPDGVSKQPPLIIRAGQTEATYKLRATSSATPGEYPISITGRENTGGNVRTGAGFHYVCSPSVTLSVGEPYVTLQLTRAAVERETIGTITGVITQHRPFSGEATLRLGRLPYGVKQVEPIPKVKNGDKTAIFRVQVSQDCLIGQYKDIFCEVTISDGGQKINQQTGSGILRVDPERKAQSDSP